MTRRGRSPAAGNGAGNDEAELPEGGEDQGTPTNADEGQATLADINAARQALLAKRQAGAEKRGKGDARLS